MKAIIAIVLSAAVSLLGSGCRDSSGEPVHVDEILAEASFLVFLRGEWKSDGELALVVVSGPTSVYGRSIVDAPIEGSVYDTMTFKRTSDQKYEFILFLQSEAGGSKYLALVMVQEEFLTGVPNADGTRVSVTELLRKIQKKPNQALQTTSVTRSGFDKVPVVDRQRRGV